MNCPNASLWPSEDCQCPSRSGRCCKEAHGPISDEQARAQIARDAQNRAKRSKRLGKRSAVAHLMFQRSSKRSGEEQDQRGSNPKRRVKKIL